MQLRSILAPLTIALCSACASTGGEDHAAPVQHAALQDAGGDAEAPAVTPEMQMEMMQLAQPGPEHEVLQKLAGTWKVEAKMWMMPGQDPLVTVIDAQSEMVLGGRFLQTTTSGELKVMGMSYPIETIGMMGFDRRNKVFTTVGFDTMGTYYVTAAGPRDAETGAIVMTGSDHDEHFGITQTYRFELRIQDDDHFTIDLYFTNPEMTHGQDEYHMVQMSYSRA